MFEDMTYENILKRTLARVSEQMDKRQGSVIYDAVAPACAELAQLYIALENTLDAAFADTAPREYLILRARERGISPRAATYAVCKGVFNMEVPEGTKFSIDAVNFVVGEKLKDFEYEMICETAGKEGNLHLGKLIAVEYIRGLTSAQLTEVLVPGEDEEDTEEFRKRYFESISGIAFAGNKADYVNNVKAMDGVGQVKVERAYNGGGNVRVIVTDTNNETPSDTLISSIKEKLDPSANEGCGMGIAPIGHRVSVEGAGKSSINIKVSVGLEDGYTASGIYGSVKGAIEKYFDEINEKWEKGDIVIYSAQILVRLIDISGIDNITSVKLNGSDYIKISGNMLAELGTLEVS